MYHNACHVHIFDGAEAQMVVLMLSLSWWDLKMCFTNLQMTLHGESLSLLFKVNVAAWCFHSVK